MVLTELDLIGLRQSLPMPLIVIPEISSNILKRLPEMPGGDDLSLVITAKNRCLKRWQQLNKLLIFTKHTTKYKAVGQSKR